jgi:hypothetical protein
MKCSDNLDQLSNRITDADGLRIELPISGPGPQPVGSGPYQTSGLKLWTRLEQREAGFGPPAASSAS